MYLQTHDTYILHVCFRKTYTTFFAFDQHARSPSHGRNAGGMGRDHRKSGPVYLNESQMNPTEKNRKNATRSQKSFGFPWFPLCAKMFLTRVPRHPLELGTTVLGTARDTCLGKIHCWDDPTGIFIEWWTGYVYIRLSIYLFFYLSIYLTTYRSIYLSNYLSVYLFVLSYLFSSYLTLSFLTLSFLSLSYLFLSTYLSSIS